MFTGLISDIGIITHMSVNQEGKIITIHAKKTAQEVALGDSVAINGTCLTVVSFNHDHFSVQAVHVTLQKTSIGTLHVGSSVNLELALKASDRLGGHFVQGHVNGIGKILSIAATGNNYEVSIHIPPALQHYMVNEGSIAVDGISLTTAKVLQEGVMVSIIPHTWNATILHHKRVGDWVNIEVDIIAKYVEQFTRMQGVKNSAINRDWLQTQGF
jgi:riboflavin synthase